MLTGPQNCMCHIMFTLRVYELISRPRRQRVNNVFEVTFGLKCVYLMRCWDISQVHCWRCSAVFVSTSTCILFVTLSWKLVVCIEWCQIIRTVFKHIITCVQECHMWMRHFQKWNLSLTSAVLKDSVMSFTKKQNFVSNQENSPKSPFEFDLLCVFPLVIDSQWQSATPCSLFEWIQWRDDVAHHWRYRQAHIVLLLADARR